MRGANHWRGHLQKSLGIDLFGHQGLAVADINGDGLDDLYVCQPGGIPNRYFEQQPNGSASDKSRRAGLDILDRSRSALFVDFDNDGDQDLALAINADLVFFENDGDSAFAERARYSVGAATTMAAADYDNDGDVDLYICGYSAPTGGENAPVPYHDANNGHRNRLFRNDGQLVFVDVTDAVGLDQQNTRYTFSGALGRLRQRRRYGSIRRQRFWAELPLPERRRSFREYRVDRRRRRYFRRHGRIVGRL